MKKFTKIIAGVTAAILTLGIAGCSEGTNYPNFINADGVNLDVDEKSEKYVINVTSEGGLKLDGVIVNAYNKSGQLVKRSMSSNGRIELGITLGEYKLEVDPDSLPAGYSVGTETYVTNPEKREEINIKLPSSLLPSNSSVNTFRAGQMMKDVTFTDCDGKKYKISELLKTKKAVVLNFFYVDCTWCKQEFPALERAYESAKSNIEVLAICSTVYADTNERIKRFKEENNLQMPMGLDDIGLCTAFGVSGYPTTAIIDRYGLVASVHENAELNSAVWSNTFNRFTADDYVQEVNATAGDNQGSATLEKPDVVMPMSTVIEEALNVEGCNATYRAEEGDEYSWPWLVGENDNGKYVYSSNKGKGNSYSILLADVEMEANQVLSFEYQVSSEKGRDLLYVLIDGDIVNGEGWSATGDWQQANIYVSERKKKVELAFIYKKDPADPDQSDPESPSIGDDEARIRNLQLYDVSALQGSTDVLRPCASGEITADRKYSEYVTPVLGADGLYHKDAANGPLLYMTVSQFTPWSDLHAGNQTEGNDYYNTLYNMTFYLYHKGQGSSFNITLDGTDVTDTVVNYWKIQNYMEGPFYLVPVTKELKIWAEKFASQYQKDHGSKSHSNEWLEFCFYYHHYGLADNKHEDDVDCKAITNNTFGLTPYNCDTVNENVRTRVNITYPLTRPNGIYYTFTAPEDGIYQIRSYTTDCSSVNADPELIVYDSDLSEILYSGFIRDFDRLTGTKYEGFNEYVTLKKGQEVKLYLVSAAGVTGYYEFDIKNLGKSFSKLFIASTGEGAWSYHEGADGSMVGDQYYLGINYAYDSENDLYYKALPNGEPDYTKPIYIDMIHGSFLYSDLATTDENSNFAPIEYLVEKNYFLKIKFGKEYQKILKNYIDESKKVGSEDEMYGLVPANAELIDILNAFINMYCGGKGEGNGWLMFACYREHFEI